MDITLIAIVLGVAVVCIAIFMEWYKKILRKDKTKAWENWLVAILLSVILSTVGYFAFSLPGTTIAVIYYSIGVFSVQLIVDMKVVKAICRWYLGKKGIKDETMKEIGL